MFDRRDNSNLFCLSICVKGLIKKCRVTILYVEMKSSHAIV